jgi:hypothetical protein
MSAIRPKDTLAKGGEERSMNDEQDKQQSEAENEIRKARGFTVQEMIARVAGPGAMKGASLVSPQQQAEIEIGTWLDGHLTDVAGCLKGVLHRQIKGSEVLLNNIDQPLVALAQHCQRILASDELLKELVRQADVEWGRSMEERPYFEVEVSSPHSEDPYTVQDTRTTLSKLVDQLC